ncbi:MAG TPA: hypothetical protein VHM25_28430, partial [Polyangiaceae bacterium]|nr:hypothetical protein [Polyangiaceae bacterium]
MSHYDQALIAVNPASKVLIGIQRVKTETGDSVDTHVYVYDPNALAWVPSQSASGGPSSDVNITNTSLAVTGTFWPTTAGAPSSVRLSDGSAFYAALKPADTLTKVATVDTITN